MKKIILSIQLGIYSKMPFWHRFCTTCWNHDENTISNISFKRGSIVDDSDTYLKKKTGRYKKSKYGGHESFFSNKIGRIAKTVPHRRLKSNMITMKSPELLSHLIKIIIQRQYQKNYQEIVIPENNYPSPMLGKRKEPAEKVQMHSTFFPHLVVLWIYTNQYFG